MRRIVVLVQMMSVAQDQAFVEFIQRQGGWGYWHWIDGAWLLAIPPFRKSPVVEVRDALQTIAPDKLTFVFEVKNVDPGFAGFGPQTAERNMFEWVFQNWIDKAPNPPSPPTGFDPFKQN